ncbi:MAG: hypothetical protein L6N95_01155 [Candidatus Methylarchaceae archaeon HK01B]|nr:hypothetical protein [Candidatus Methylarchaceae archaeon HK01B]
MPFCSKCGGSIPGNSKFCHLCGTPVSMKDEVDLTSPEIRIMYILTSHKGKSTFTRMMGESGMCFGMFSNNAESLIKKGLIEKGETLKDYVLTPKGKRHMLKRYEKGEVSYRVMEGFLESEGYRE